VKVVHSDKKNGTCLTRQGKELLEKYRLLKQQCMAADDKIFRRAFHEKDR